MRAPRRRSLGFGGASLVALVVLLVPLAVWARPGGGESYSGGGSSGGGSGGGGGGGDGGCAFLLIRLWIQFVISYPAIGIPATIAIVAFLVLRQRRRAAAGSQSWTSAPSVAARSVPPSRRVGRDLEAVRGLDPEFSLVLFDDFVYSLYARAHEARSSADALAALAPYLSASARQQLASRAPVGAPVSGVVIGALRVVDLSIPFPPPVPPATSPLPLPSQAPSPLAGPTSSSPPLPPGARVVVVLEFESNLTVGVGGTAHTQYLKEQWRLERDAAVRSRPPEAVGDFHCPNCGAPYEGGASGRCAYCGQVVSGGRFDWSVESIALTRIEDRPPSLTGTVAEVGTDFPTVVHPQMAARWTELTREDPATTDQALAARLALIYGELNAAWTGLDLAKARPFVSDGLFDYLQYWISAYRSQGLRNVLEGLRITRTTLAKVVRDKHFDAVTFRLWAAGHDSTVRVATGEVVAGNPRDDRAYSEYWTLIRGAAVRGTPRTDRNCPNCGAPLEINMAGACEHCGAKLTSGEFDWVLSKIEQDDSYTG